MAEPRGSRRLTLRIGLAVGLMLLPVAGVIAVATFGMQAANSDVDVAIEQAADGVLPIVQLRAEVSSLAVLGSRAAVGISAWDDYEARAAAVERDFARILDGGALTRAEMASVGSAFDSYRAANQTLDEVRASGDWLALLDGFAAGMNDVSRRLGTAESLALGELEAASERARDAEARSRAIVMGLGIGAVVGALVLAFGLGRSVLRPLRTIHTGLRHLAEGDLSYRIDLRRSDEIGEVAAAVDMMTDRLQRANAELAHRSLHDALTGLPNRVLFLDRTEQALRRMERNDGLIAVMLVDLDGFKEINDAFGHNAGDRVLVEVATRITQSLRGVDTAARIGGDEFALLIEQSGGSDDALVLAERVRTALAAPFSIDGTDAELGGSIGVVVAQPDATPVDLVHDADLAMYEAKASGKNRVVVFEPRMQTAARERSRLASELRTAIDDGQLVLVYQPIVEIATRRPRGVEALVRWDHPERGLLTPDTFVPLAEETGLISSLDRWVMREACRQLQEWRQLIPETRGLRMAVNVSYRQLHRSEIVEHVTDALSRSGLPPAHLTLEITEKAAIQRGAGATFEQLRALGVRIAIDNFGTGSVSLAQLADLPIDAIKIDSSFVPSGDESPDNASLLSAIIAVARSMNLVPIAEGVENDYQTNVLQMLGCKFAQGFGMARPDTVPRITEYLQLHASARDVTATEVRAKAPPPASDAFAVLSSNGRVRHASTEIAALLGYRPDEKIGTNFLDLVHPDDRSRAVESFLIAQTTPGGHGPLRFRVLCGDGTWVDFEVTSESRIDDPEVHGVIVYLAAAAPALSERSQ